MRKVIASLDVGSEFIKLVVAECIKGKVNILGVSSVSSLGIKKGFVIDPNALIPRLQEAFNKCEEMIGLKIRKVIITSPSDDASFVLVEGSANINNDEHIVKNSDIIRAIQASTTNAVAGNEEIVSLEPTSYIIDDDLSVKNPLGQEAVKLTVKALLVTIPRKNVFSLVKCLEKIGVEVVDFTLSSIGDYYACRTLMMNDVVGSIINIGYQTTTVSIFNKGLLTNTNVLNIGSSSIEHDLAYIFGINKKDAKTVKTELAHAHKNGVSASNSLTFTNKEGENVSISEYEATLVTSSRLEEILKMAKKEINLLTKKEIHYIMVTGGVSELANFSLLLENVFGHNAKIINIKEIGVRSNIYSPAVGLIKYYDEKTRKKNIDFSIWNEEETEELGSVRKVNFNENSILGKLFGYFFND